MASSDFVNTLMLIFFPMLCFTESPTKIGSVSEREVLCVSLKKDPKLGLGKLITLEHAASRERFVMFVIILFCLTAF